MSIPIDVQKIPSEYREAIVRLHFQKTAPSLGYRTGSQEEVEFINRETDNVLKKGHPLTINLTVC